MADAASVLSRLIAALTISDPQWDTSVGSATYKILEAVSQEIATTNNNSILQTYSYDVNSKFGSELDAFCNLFGVNRQLGARATGSITFYTTGLAVQDYDIPLGTQVYAVDSNGVNIYFTTSSPATLSAGQQSVEVPIISVLTGAYNNVNADTITNWTTALTGITSVSNGNALSGGADTETDDQFKLRFRVTAFSNFSGTNQKYLSLALQNPNVSQVNVVGAEEVALEQLQVQTLISGGGTSPGTSNFNIALQNKAQLTVQSGATTASGYSGPLAQNVTIPASSITTSPAGIYTGTVVWDGTNYNLSTYATNSGILTINHIVSGTAPVTFSGGSTYGNLQTAISGLLGGANGSPLPYDALISVTVTGTNSVASGGAYVAFSQPLPYNLIVNSGALASGINTVTSKIVDSKYTYPQGNEIVGVGLGGNSQIVFSNNVDYYYPASTAAPLKLTLNPLASNSPYLNTGNNIQVQSEYVPSGSRVSNPATNSNYIDIFINGTTVTPTVEQIILLQNNQFGAAGTILPSGNFLTASGGSPRVGDHYITPSTKPIGNYPAQTISGNAPSYLQFANYQFPVCLLPPGSKTVAVASGVSSSNILYTTSSVSGWAPGMVITSGYPAIPIGTYVQYVIPGSPNLLYLSNNLTNNLATTNVSGVVVAYPVYDNTTSAGSKLDLGGVAIVATDPVSYPSGVYPSTINGVVGTMGFNYYSDVVEIDDIVQQAKIVGTNTLVHQASYLNLIVNLSIIYTGEVSISSVNAQIQTALVALFSSLSFSGTLKFTDIVRTVVNIPGVSNCRVSTLADNSTNYGLVAVHVDGSTKQRYTSDVLLANDQLPSVYKVNYTAFGDNNF